jgi:type I restriction enzyme S subunit
MHTEYQMRLVGDLCSFINGNGFSEKQWALEGLPIIRIQNLNGSNKFNYFDGQTKESWIIEPGDLLFAWAGVKGVSFGPCIWNGPRGVLNQHIYKVVASNEVDRNWLYAALKMVTERIESNAHGFKTSLVHVHKKDITSQVIYVPNLGEQKVIAATLSKWDEAIGKTGKLIELKESFFQSLLSSKILNKTFRRRKLGTMIYEISQRNQKGALRVLSVTNHRGFVLPEDQFERRVASQNLDNYKVVCKGQFAYNPSRINVGSIARLDNWETGVLSPMYVVFGVYENVIHSDFLFYYRQMKPEKEFEPRLRVVCVKA